MIIFFNGASSSGKSSVARAMQHLNKSARYMIIGQDSFIKMMPYGMLGFQQFAKEGFFFEYLDKGDLDPRVAIKTGDFGLKIIEASAKTAATLADAGFNVIVDEVLFDTEFAKLYLKHLSHHKVYFIKVHCDLEILVEREVLRGDRSWGLARHHFNTLHRDEYLYDFKIDTSRTPSFELANQIFEFLKNNKDPQGFVQMRKNLTN